MVPTPSITQRRIAITLFVLGLVLLTAPVWVDASGIGEDRTVYERVEVTANGGTIEYVERPAATQHTPLSEDLGCTLDQPWTSTRGCSHEEGLTGSETGAVVSYTDDPENDNTFLPSKYDYVALDDGVYEQTVTVGDEQQAGPDGDRGYPVSLDVSRVDAQSALRELSVSVDDVPSTVADTARSGETTTDESVDVPPHPIRLEDGSYVRVYRHDSTAPPRWEGIAASLGTYLLPLFGLLAFMSWYRRVEIHYVDPELV